MEFNPGGWLPEMTVTTNVGLGTGQTEEKMAALGQIAAKQEQIIMQLGPNNPICGMAQYAATLQKMVEISPVNNPSKYFNPPEMVAQQGQQQQGQDPAQAEQQAAMAEAQMKAQTEMQKAQLKAQTDLQVAQLKAQVDAMTMQQGAAIDAQTKLEVAQINAQIDLAQTEYEGRLKEMELAAEAALEKYAVDMKADTDVRLRSPTS
jgi:hypothetical protein